MSEPFQSNIGTSLLAFHTCITRSIDVVAERSQSFAERGFSDAAIRAGFVDYVQSFASLTIAHHITEDDVAFPYFREKMPDAPFDALSVQHMEMHLLLEQIAAVAAELASGAPAQEPLARLARTAASLGRLWDPHRRTEESYLTPERCGAMIDPEENARVGAMFAEHTMKGASPDYLVVPFMIYNMAPPSRELVTREMPPVLVRELVPLVWKDKWAPMAPFLLP
jgi:hemerythrin-like domain-containing protein